MNKEQLDAIRLYCKLTFGTTDVGVAEAIDCIDEDAFDAGLTRLQYILIILQLMVLSLSSNRIRCRISNSLINCCGNGDSNSWSYKRGNSLSRNIIIFVSRIGNIKRSNRSISFRIFSFTSISNTFNSNINSISYCYLISQL